MAYTKKTWRDRKVEFADVIRLTSRPDGTFLVERAEGRIDVEGDKFDSVTMNDLEKRIADAFDEKVDKTSKSYSYDLTIPFSKSISIDYFASAPNIKFKPRHYVNLLGRDGDCEDVNKWALNSVTSSLESTSKVYGGNSIKITLTSTSGSIHKNPFEYDSSKRYLVTAYCKNGNASAGIGVQTANASSSLVTNNSKFERVGVKVLGSNATFVAIQIVGASGQYGWVDGIQVNEISETEYANDSVDVLMAKYPYVESLGVTKNIYVESVSGNLVKNGNGEEGLAYWTSLYPSNSTIKFVNGNFECMSTVANNWYQIVNVEPNTDYYLGGNVTNGLIQAVNMEETVQLGVLGVFNTGGNSSIKIRMTNDIAKTSYYNSISLTKGVSAPTSYKSSIYRRCVLIGDWFGDDKPELIDGQLRGFKYWGILNSKDFVWKHNAGGTGRKGALIPNPVDNGIDNTMNTFIGVKPNGKILKNVSAYTDASDVFYKGTTNLVVMVDNVDSGFNDSLQPDENEWTAVIAKGWKAIYTDGARYKIFKSSVDGSYVPGFYANVTSSGTSNILTVDNAAIFSIGEWVAVALKSNFSNIGIVNITGISGNQITVNSNVTSNGSDVGMFKMNAIDYCKTNEAVGYTGYKFAYKFAQPKPINEDTDSYYAPLKGNPPLFRPGNNMLSVKNGMVLGELAPFGFNTNNYLLNYSVVGGVWGDTRMKSKVESFIAGYKNGVSNFNEWISTKLPDAFGKERMSISLDLFDKSASYTADYEILRTDAPQIGGCEISYSEGLSDGMSALFEIDKSKQNQDIVLDTISDWGKMQVIKEVVIVGRAYTLSYASGTFPSLYQTFLLTPRNLNPSASAKINYCYIYDANGAINNVPIGDVQIGINSGYKDKVRVVVAYCGSNATLKTNATTYGMAVNFDIVLDSEL